ncbi:nuclear receptor-binding factor 2-like [Amyelois transitella]|uniref:nuclear receptor-binding factor 2-like n=1 Tax=Amyelois transitella TaxID=680683 RepID=UPI00067B401A|nr:nuclear receptor-binding factor 2-like [Amyelois transitella]
MMESHPLNLAHQQHRRAEAHLVNNKYDEAMQCHQNAAELLLDAMKSTTSSIALESITLQRSYHLKQKDLIKSKKEQYFRVKKAMDNLKCLGYEQLQNLQGSDSTRLEVAIYRTIFEHESLIKMLIAKNDVGKGKDVNRGDTIDGKKIEKEEKILEELKHLNENMHRLVDQLILQVEVLKDDSETLKDKVNFLEKERMRYLYTSAQNELNVINIGSGMCDESIKETVPRVPITKLTSEGKPLNLQPNFDLSAFKI